MSPAELDQARAKYAHLIKPCAGVCGRDTRSTRVPKNLFEDTVIRVTASMCNSCNKALTPEDPEAADRAAAEKERRDRITAERIAAAHRARAAVEADRAARRNRAVVRRVNLGQSTVRI